MRGFSLKAVCLVWVQVLAIQAWGLDPNACKNPTSNGYVVNNVNSRDPISLVSHSDALRLFNELKNPQHRIPYLNANNNCDARGHRISQILKTRYNLSTIKIFVEAVNEEFYGAGAPSFMRDEFTDDGTRVTLGADDILGQHHTWRYHTAPALCVRKDGKDELYIFDLSLFNEPVPYTTWRDKMTRGLSASDYEVTSTNMYFMSQQSPHQPPRSQFEQWETSMVTDALNKDWPAHQRLLQNQNRTPLAPTPNATY